MFKPEGVIFDLDGTLIDSMGMWTVVDQIYLKSKGREPKPDLASVLKKMSMNQTIRHFQEEYQIDEPTEKIISDIHELAHEAYRSQIPLKEGALSLLDFFRREQTKMCIATANHRPLAEAAILRLGLGEYMSHLLTCDEAGFSKEHPHIFHQALDLLQTPLENTFVFEDSLHAVETAKAAGFFVVAVYDPSAEEEAPQIKQIANLYLKSLLDWPGLSNS